MLRAVAALVVERFGPCESFPAEDPYLLWKGRRRARVRCPAVATDKIRTRTQEAFQGLPDWKRLDGYTDRSRLRAGGPEADAGFLRDPIQHLFPRHSARCEA